LSGQYLKSETPKYKGEVQPAFTNDLAAGLCIGSKLRDTRCVVSFDVSWLEHKCFLNENCTGSFCGFDLIKTQEVSMFGSSFIRKKQNHKFGHVAIHWIKSKII
jgi:hypothetical protein